MKYRISYNVCGMEFHADADTISQAYRYVEAIVKQQKINFPDIDVALDEYMDILCKLRAGTLKNHSNFIFKVEALVA